MNDKMDIFNYFQITVLFLFYLIFIRRSLQLKLKGINPFVLGTGKKGLKKLLEISLSIGLVIWTLEVIRCSLNLGFHIFPEVLYTALFQMIPLKIVGVTFIVLGFVIFIWALISFGSSWRVGIDKQNPGQLVTSGIFTMTRNPIFMFLDLYFVGTWLIYSNLFFLTSSVLVGFGIHYQILQEEKFLIEQYGEEYKDYMKKVRRYF
ncbi:MAG: isoprenylcysteine carboxylmethyltransferase family protein [Elusimicrobiota bacterium]